MLSGCWRKSSRSTSNGHCLEARWRKSSHSFQEANCLEAAWHRSSRCASNECTEAALCGGTVLVRDSKLGDGSPVLAFSPADWQAFLEGVKGAA